MRFGRLRAVGLVVLVVLGAGAAFLAYDRVYGHMTLVELDARSCPGILDEASFASEGELRDALATVTGFGLRSTGSPAHNALIEWLEDEFGQIPGVEVETDPFDLVGWIPTGAAVGDGGPLQAAASLALLRPGEADRSLPVAGALPYARPAEGVEGELLLLPADEPLTAEAVRGRIVVQEVPLRSIPLAAFWALSHYTTSDIWSDLTGFFERPYLTTGEPLALRVEEAGSAGAAGIVFLFDVPREQIADYFNPHTGTHFALPALYLGADEGEALREAAEGGLRARMGIEARLAAASTRNLIARLPGSTAERIVINTNTDGNTHIQENAVGGLVALARALARIPVECRSRTVEFVMGSGHLHMSKEGTRRYVDGLSSEQRSSIAFSMSVEHLGAREILPVGRSDGPGRTLEFTGKGEFLGWFVGDSRPLLEASIAAVRHRALDRVAVLPGQDLPQRNRVPRHCSLGGLGTYFNEALIPSIGLISGPWSLWAPSFGEEAVDFARMRRQLLAVGDVVRAMDGVPIEQIVDGYAAARERRAAGAPGCEHPPIPEFAAGVSWPPAR